MKYFYIEPEVAGGLGEHSVLDSSTHPPKVSKLHYKFDGWLGDVLLESFPCLIATDAAADALRNASLTGVDYAEVEVSASETYRELYPQRTLPLFQWLKITGIAGKDDFGIAEDLRAVVSQRVLDILNPLGIDNALVEEYQ
ncbi:hypothetical protein [Burkholderia metallica]|uniref:hypothetical protein n=1 Tax=Burkholderia metallica TaxID=488729 RepID=UPI000D19B079|nr:hypothetical protein [Burkholderia metallica]